MTTTIENASGIRKFCVGEVPLEARLEPWMQQCVDHPRMFDWIEEFGSPLNIIHTEPMARNISELQDVALHRGVKFKIYFARKSNKCLSFVDHAIAAGIGVDTASENEVQQCLDRGVAPDDLVCTAAVKSESLLTLCITRGICVAVDNQDELDRIATIAGERDCQVPIALRLGGFHHNGKKLQTRFGFDVDRDAALISKLDRLPIEVVGVHFHLDGYDAEQRVSALDECLGWVELLRVAGHLPKFIDMGGGFPMSYLESDQQWQTFWREHGKALLGGRDQVTYRNHGLGRMVHGGEIIGRPNSYPYYQTPTKAKWLEEILDDSTTGNSLSQMLIAADIELRCEPGRSLMDGCGITIARVEFRKQTAGGDWLIGLSMNRTQCRTSSDDFLVDPILIPGQQARGNSMSGYLVGAYCTESELLSLRRLNFPEGVCAGDLIAFPNTAGYLMHFLESRSHQFPLAKNYIWDQAVLDPIDRDD